MIRYQSSINNVLILLFTSLLIAIVLPSPLSRLDVPYGFSGDATDKIVQIKNVAETGWLFHNDRLGYPFAYDRLDFPRFDSLNYAIMGPIAAITGEAGLAMNVYFLASFYLIAFSAFWCFRRLELDVGPALICALAFAFLPYHFVRGVAHLTNGAYFLIPFAMLVLVRVAQDRLGVHTADARRRWVFAILIAVLLPLQTPYNGFFFAFLCVVAGGIALAQEWRLRKILVVASLLIATGGTFVVEQIPRFMHQAEHGRVDTGSRPLSDAQLYSMNLTQVILPTENHRLRIFRETSGAFNESMMVPRNEARSQYIGLLGLVGLSVLIIFVFGLSRDNKSKFYEQFDIIAIISIFIILFAISTGIGTLVSYFFVSSIRALNRILPFLAFAALAGGGLALHLLTRRITNAWLRAGVIGGLGLVVLLDVVPRGMTAEQRNATIAEYDRTREYFSQVEMNLPDGSAVFQMPVIWYPEHPPVNRMSDYDNLKPFLLTEALRFSAGVSRNRPGYAWGKLVEQQSAAEIIAQTHAVGFGALLVDAFAYETEELSELTDGFTQLLPEPPLVSPDGRWWTFSLEGCCGPRVPQLERGTQLDVFNYAPGGEPITFAADGSGALYRLNGWNDVEQWGMWASSEASLRLHLTSVPIAPLRLSLDTRMMLGPNIPTRTLRMECNGQPCGEFSYTLATAVQRLQVTLPPGLVEQDGRLELRFVSSPDATPRTAGVNEDGRSLGVGLTSLSLSPAE